MCLMKIFVKFFLRAYLLSFFSVLKQSILFWWEPLVFWVPYNNLVGKFQPPWETTAYIFLFPFILLLPLTVEFHLSDNASLRTCLIANLAKPNSVKGIKASGKLLSPLSLMHSSAIRATFPREEKKIFFRVTG